MNILVHEGNGSKTAEVSSEQVLIHTAQDALQLMMDLYYQGFDRIAIHEKNITPAFFDLKNGIAGEVLQKFSNYRMKLAVIGDFSKYSSKSIRDFIYESNKQGHTVFLPSIDQWFTDISASK